MCFHNILPLFGTGKPSIVEMEHEMEGTATQTGLLWHELLGAKEETIHLYTSITNIYMYVCICMYICI